MNRQRWPVWLRVGFVVVATPLLFVLLEAPARSLEIRADVGVMHLLRIGGLPLVTGAQALVQPMHGEAFWVYLSPSCSSLASILTLGCIAAALPGRVAGGGRRLLAFLAAAAAVFIGNMLRIDLSIGAGLVRGQTMLVLFHNWAGSVFAFVYTMGGFIVMLWLLLPDRRKGAAEQGTALSRVGAATPAGA